MAAYLERYTSGEYEAVWNELMALGAGVFDEPVHSDALVVARETMRRARANIVAILARLKEIGYEFDTAQHSEERRKGGLDGIKTMLEGLKGLGQKQFDLGRMQQMLANARAVPVLPARPPADPTADERVYVPATGDARVLEFEERLGSRLPLSLRAWYEVIDTVSLMGAHPRLNPSEKPRRPAMYVNSALFSLPGGSERLEEQRKKMARLGMDLTTELPNANPEPLADPLVIFPLDALEDCMEDQDEEIYDLPIAPDELHKANISGDAYYIRLPHAGADLPFDDWHKTTFTGYLREVFRWGGFPGWSRSKRPPVEELEFLTRSLLPL